MTQIIDCFLYGLFIFSYLFDPTGRVIFLKLPALLLLVIWSFISRKNIKAKNVMFFCIIYIVLCISTLNMMFMGYNYRPLLFFNYFKTFLTVFIFIFIFNKKYVFQPFKIMCLFLSLFTIVVSIITIKYKMIAYIFLLRPFNILFKIQQRSILGKMYSQIFHLSSPLIILQLGLSFSDLLLTKKKRNLIFVILFCIALFFSGTRANMLAGILTITLIYLYYEYKIKGRIYWASFLLTMITFLGAILVYLLLTDSTSGSNNIKSLHIKSAFELFENLNILLLGNGPASEYYTEGFHSYTNITELSYLDLVRLFGIFGAILIVFIYAYPLIPIFSRKTVESFSFGISYLAYLFIAGTNPLLIVPQGFVAIIMAYSYVNEVYYPKSDCCSVKKKVSFIRKYFFKLPT